MFCYPGLPVSTPVMPAASVALPCLSSHTHFVVVSHCIIASVSGCALGRGWRSADMLWRSSTGSGKLRFRSTFLLWWRLGWVVWQQQQGARWRQTSGRKEPPDASRAAPISTWRPRVV